LIDEGYPDFYTPDPVSLNQYIIDSSDDSGEIILMLVMRTLIESGYISKRGVVTLGRVIAKNAEIIGKQALITYIIGAAVTLGILAATALSVVVMSVAVTFATAKITGTAVTAAGLHAAVVAGATNAWNPVGWVIIAVLAIIAIISIIVLVNKIAKVKWKLFKNLSSITVKSNGTYYLKEGANIQPNNSDFEELDNLGKTVLKRFSATRSNMVLYRLCESDESIRSVIVSINGQYIQIDVTSSSGTKREYNRNIKKYQT